MSSVNSKTATKKEEKENITNVKRKVADKIADSIVKKTSTTVHTKIAYPNSMVKDKYKK